MNKKLTIALAGNPNCGKTVLFNRLTGSRQQVGNWPGVTVDRKSGEFFYQNQTIQLVDLPGTYSISVNDESALDEKIACEFLSSGQADAVVNVIDGSNLLRNLYLTLQLTELGIPVVLAVNMMDIVKSRGVAIDLKRLQQMTGCPVVPVTARQGIGVNQLKSAVVALANKPSLPHSDLPLPLVLQQSVTSLTSTLLQHGEVDQPRARWLALRLLEHDQFARTQVAQKVIDELGFQHHLIEQKSGEEADILIADARYRKASQISDTVLSVKKSLRKTATERIDRLILNRFLGIPIFFLVMYGLFVFAINIGGAFQDFFDISSQTIFVDGLAYWLTQWHWSPWLVALLSDGFGQGINTIVTFIPIIAAMFLFLAFLEDCGYMARAAFVMDRAMRLLGLPGKSFVPMIVGFGCNVPAVMGARTLANRRDRILTILMVPFMSCGARLAIFSVFASAFFPQSGALIIFTLYLTGILVAVLSGLLLRRTVLAGQSEPLVMELPAYHVPRLGSLIRHAWYRLKGFVLRAGKYILPICVLLGVLNSVSIRGHLVEPGSPQSLLSHLGRVVTPVFSPMGITQDNWPATVGLATGVLAKEVVVGTLNSLYSHSQGEREFDFWGGLYAAVSSVPENLAGVGAALANPIAASRADYDDLSRSAYGAMVAKFDGKLGAFAYLLFVLLYFPCVSTMAVMRREIGAGWAYFSVMWSTGLAYALAVITYQLSNLWLHPLSSLVWTVSLGLLLLMVMWGLRYYAAGDRSALQPQSPQEFGNVT